GVQGGGSFGRTLAGAGQQRCQRIWRQRHGELRRRNGGSSVSAWTAVLFDSNPAAVGRCVPEERLIRSGARPWVRAWGLGRRHGLGRASRRGFGTSRAGQFFPRTPQGWSIRRPGLFTLLRSRSRRVDIYFLLRAHDLLTAYFHGFDPHDLVTHEADGIHV